MKVRLNGGEVSTMPWYWIVALVCFIIAPFDALYMHIKADRRREALKREKEKREAQEKREQDMRPR